MKLNTENILKLNNYLINLIQQCEEEDINIELETALKNALKHIEDPEEIIEMKQYWFDVTLEMHAVIDSVKANTADEAQEIFEDILDNNEDYVTENHICDFYIGNVTQTGTTKEYQQYIINNKK